MLIALPRGNMLYSRRRSLAAKDPSQPCLDGKHCKQPSCTTEAGSLPCCTSPSNASRAKPGTCSRNHCTCKTFSSGSMEHVEYTKQPPALTVSAAARSSSLCNHANVAEHLHRCTDVLPEDSHVLQQSAKPQSSSCCGFRLQQRLKRVDVAQSTDRQPARGMSQALHVTEGVQHTMGGQRQKHPGQMCEPTCLANVGAQGCSTHL